MDIFNIPNTNLNNQVFFTNGSTNWQIWQKPKNCKFVYMFLIGGGGGGGSGAGSAALATNEGGNGGGSSSITTGIFPSNLLPDTLYIQVGVGGSGGSGVTGASNGNPGLSGTISYVSILPTTGSSNVILASGSVGAGGGGGGGTITVGSGGVSFTRTLGSSTGILNYLGTIESNTGQSSTDNTSGAIGVSVTPSFPVTAGAGGGGVNAGVIRAGGSISSLGLIPQISGGTNGGDGNNGFSNVLPSSSSSLQFPVYFTGGAGGSSSVSSTIAGRGGNGSYGSGGGGGGSISKSDPKTSGAGGRGGDGLVIINCW